LWNQQTDLTKQEISQVLAQMIARMMPSTKKEKSDEHC
jgi:hypothetical protein